jgi:hypothetical protein
MMMVPFLDAMVSSFAYYQAVQHMQAVEEMKKRGLVGVADFILFSSWRVEGRKALLRHWNQRPYHPQPENLFRMAPHP